MAITKTTKVDRITVYPALDGSAANTNAGNAWISVSLIYVLDDSEDDDLPVTSHQEKQIFRYVEDGGAATDVSGEDALVQTICGAIWS